MRGGAGLAVVAVAVVAVASLATETNAQMLLLSPAFENMAAIPPRFVCDDKERDPFRPSPPLAWRRVPAATRSFVLLMDNVDTDEVHWLAKDIPGDVESLGADASQTDMPFAAVEKPNSFDTEGYSAPCPNNATHHFRFRLFAMPTATVTNIPEHTPLQASAVAHYLEQSALYVAVLGGEATLGPIHGVYNFSIAQHSVLHLRAKQMPNCVWVPELIDHEVALLGGAPVMEEDGPYMEFLFEGMMVGIGDVLLSLHCDEGFPPPLSEARKVHEAYRAHDGKALDDTARALVQAQLAAFPALDSQPTAHAQGSDNDDGNNAEYPFAPAPVEVPIRIQVTSPQNETKIEYVVVQRPPMSEGYQYRFRKPSEVTKPARATNTHARAEDVGCRRAEGTDECVVDLESQQLVDVAPCSNQLKYSHAGRFANGTQCSLRVSLPSVPCTPYELPSAHTCLSPRPVSPAITWSGLPVPTRGVVVVVEDAGDANRGTHNGTVLWAVADVRADVNGLEYGASNTDKMPALSVELVNTDGVHGYSAPCTTANTTRFVRVHVAAMAHARTLVRLPHLPSDLRAAPLLDQLHRDALCVSSVEVPLSHTARADQPVAVATPRALAAALVPASRGAVVQAVPGESA